jgi:uncharacterized membrane protein
MGFDKKDLFKSGTNLNALICGIIGFAVALLALLIGFWKTLLLVAFFAVGYIVGKTGIVQRLFEYVTDRFRVER